MQIVSKNGIYYLSGRLDEYADFDALKGATEPLKLNLGGIASINSVGVRRFLAFTLSWAPKRFEFFECTPEFIANVNVIPQMLGDPKNKGQIKSFFVPYGCDSCKRLENVLIHKDAVKAGSSGVELPQKSCDRCGSAMEPEVEKHEYFNFLGAAAS